MPTVALQPADDDPLPHPEFITQWRDDPSDLAQRAEVRRLIAEALDELDEKYRVVFVLRDIQGLSYQNISDITGLNLGTVKSKLARGRLALKIQLKGRI